MNKYSLVIVENDEDEQLFMKEAFDASPHFEIVFQARNGDVLFDWLEQKAGELPDLILSDLNMPGKNGYDIIKEVGENPGWRNIPVVITSTSSTPVIMNRCLEMGAAAYLIKPDTFLDYEPFVEQLYRLLIERARHSRQL